MYLEQIQKVYNKPLDSIKIPDGYTLASPDGEMFIWRKPLKGDNYLNDAHQWSENATGNKNTGGHIKERLILFKVDKDELAPLELKQPATAPKVTVIYDDNLNGKYAAYKGVDIKIPDDYVVMRDSSGMPIYKVPTGSQPYLGNAGFVALTNGGSASAIDKGKRLWLTKKNAPAVATPEEPETLVGPEFAAAIKNVYGAPFASLNWKNGFEPARQVNGSVIFRLVKYGEYYLSKHGYDVLKVGGGNKPTGEDVRRLIMVPVKAKAAVVHAVAKPPQDNSSNGVAIKEIYGVEPSGLKIPTGYAVVACGSFWDFRVPKVGDLFRDIYDFVQLLKLSLAEVYGEDKRRIILRKLEEGEEQPAAAAKATSLADEIKKIYGKNFHALIPVLGNKWAWKRDSKNAVQLAVPSFGECYLSLHDTVIALFDVSELVGEDKRRLLVQSSNANVAKYGNVYGKHTFEVAVPKGFQPLLDGNDRVFRAPQVGEYFIGVKGDANLWEEGDKFSNLDKRRIILTKVPVTPETDNPYSEALNDLVAPAGFEFLLDGSIRLFRKPLFGEFYLSLYSRKASRHAGTDPAGPDKRRLLLALKDSNCYHKPLDQVAVPEGYQVVKNSDGSIKFEIFCNVPKGTWFINSDNKPEQNWSDGGETNPEYRRVVIEPIPKDDASSANNIYQLPLSLVKIPKGFQAQKNADGSIKFMEVKDMPVGELFLNSLFTPDMRKDHSYAFGHKRIALEKVDPTDKPSILAVYKKPVVLPDGYKHQIDDATGKPVFRNPKTGEQFLTDSHSVLTCGTEMYGPRLILLPKDNEYGKAYGLVTVPKGYEHKDGVLTFRLPLPNELFVSIGGAVTSLNKGYKKPRVIVEAVPPKPSPVDYDDSY